MRTNPQKLLEGQHYGQKITESSAFMRWLIIVLPSIQAVPQEFTSFDKSPIKTVKRKGDKMLSCIIP